MSDWIKNFGLFCKCLDSIHGVLGQTIVSAADIDQSFGEGIEVRRNEGSDREGEP